MEVKPFLKWAGGKSKLIPKIINILPTDFNSYDTYIEPFLGSGAFLFWVLQNTKIKNIIVNDLNKDLTNSYLTIIKSPDKLIKELKQLQDDFLKSENKSTVFYEIRRKFNIENDILKKTSYFIFLNKTCFNGLFRVNSKNEFNVPFGKYENPKICDEENIINISNLLENTVILNEDYSKTIDYIKGETLFYLDPPYKPISKTSSFTSYSSVNFCDENQINLKHFCDVLTEKDVKWILSNSDLKNTDSNNNFFDNLYKDYDIKRVLMKRSINSNASKRGDIFELLIKNY